MCDRCKYSDLLEGHKLRGVIKNVEVRVEGICQSCLQIRLNKRKDLKQPAGV